MIVRLRRPLSVFAVGGLVCALANCKLEEPEVRIRVEQLPEKAAKIDDQREAERFKAPDWRPRLDEIRSRPGGIGLEASPPGGAAKSAAEPPPRDYGAELETAIGDPTSCLSRATARGSATRISLQIEAMVVESGMITRAYVTGSDLDADSTSCIRRRVEQTRLRAPIEAAPRSVRATLTLTRPATHP